MRPYVADGTGSLQVCVRPPPSGHGLPRGGRPRPTSVLADAKHRHGLTAQVGDGGPWPRDLAPGPTEDASAAALTPSYGALQHAAVQHEPSSRVRGILTDGCDRTTQRLRTLFPGVCLGTCLCHAINKLPGNLAALSSSVRKALASPFHPCGPEHDSATACACVRWANGCVAWRCTSALRLERPRASARHWIPEQKAGW